jgi:hypothetical protein
MGSLSDGNFGPRMVARMHTRVVRPESIGVFEATQIGEIPRQAKSQYIAKGCVSAMLEPATVRALAACPVNFL